MNNFIGIPENEIEESVIKPHGGIEYFRLVKCPGYKIPRYLSSDGVEMDLVIEDDSLNDATIAYLESHGVQEVDWQE